MDQLTDQDFPSLFRSADRESLRAQAAFIRATRWRLGLAIAAAVFAAFAVKVHVHEHPVLDYVAAATFIAALLIEVWLILNKPEETWYDGRALAESAKTLTWRYAVGGHPFAHDSDAPRDYLRLQLAELLEDAPSTSITTSDDEPLSEAVARLRESSLQTRRDTYLAQRVNEQQRWYSRKAAYNARWGRRWKQLLIGIEVVGAVAALLKALEVIDVDLTSIASTAIGVGVAWLAVKQHDQVGRAYTFAAHELALVAARLEGPMSEDEWADAVGEAEGAISREHTMWRASHVVREPLPEGRAR